MNRYFIYVMVFILIMMPIGAYVDTIRTGIYPFQQYFAICLWEAGLVFGGIGTGMFLEEMEEK